VTWNGSRDTTQQGAYAVTADDRACATRQPRNELLVSVTQLMLVCAALLGGVQPNLGESRTLQRPTASVRCNLTRSTYRRAACDDDALSYRHTHASGRGSAVERLCSPRIAGKVAGGERCTF
jgi:hypothetical protein